MWYRSPSDLAELKSALAKGVGMGEANTVPRKINGVEGVAGQLIVSGGPGEIETWSKIGSTSLGGITMQLTNKTGVASVKGTIVIASTIDDDSFILSGVSEDQAIGVVFESGVADGSLCWVVIAGVAEVLLEDTTASTHGNWVYASATAGRANATLANPPGGGIPELDQHMQEIGHCLQSIAGGTDVLCRIKVQFN